MWNARKLSQSESPLWDQTAVISLRGSKRLSEIHTTPRYYWLTWEATETSRLILGKTTNNDTYTSCSRIGLRKLQLPGPDPAGCSILSIKFYWDTTMFMHFHITYGLSSPPPMLQWQSWIMTDRALKTWNIHSLVLHEKVCSEALKPVMSRPLNVQVQILEYWFPREKK